MKNFKLKRTEQCEHCPWKLGNNPYEIPNGYDREKHQRLEITIARELTFVELLDELGSDKELRIMACHEEHASPCVGWLMNQLGPGNNIRLRMAMGKCTNLGEVKLHGPQHETFEDTIPEALRPAIYGVPDTMVDALKPMTFKGKVPRRNTK